MADHTYVCDYLPETTAHLVRISRVFWNPKNRVKLGSNPLAAPMLPKVGN